MELAINTKQQRNKKSKYLETIFINRAIDTFYRYKPVLLTNENIIEKKWYKYSLNITRRWLNYLDNEKFNELFSKKLDEIFCSTDMKDEQNYP